MNEIITYLMLGLGTGALYALLSCGLITIHRGSGVINLSQGAITMVSAFSFATLQPPVGTVPAMALAIATAACIGLATYILVMRPLRAAPSLARLVASLGVLLVLQAGAVLLFETGRTASPDVWRVRPYHVLGASVPPIRVYLVVTAVVLTGALALVFARSTFGVFTRAASESEKGVILLGRSPGRIAAVNWSLGCAISGIAGIFAASLVGLQPENLMLLVVPGLAGALFARFSSFFIATMAALSIGVAQSFLSGYWGQAGLRDLVPFAVLLMVLLLSGKPIPTRGTILVDARLPAVTSARPTWGALIALVAAIIFLLTQPPVYQNALTTSAIAAIIALSLVVLTGYVGQISLAQLVIAGVGGFSTSRFAVGMDLPFPLPLLLGAAAAALFGLLLGIPSLRVRGHNLAVLTLAAGVTIQSALFSNLTLTGGAGGSAVPPPTLGSFSLDPFLHGVRFGILTLVVLVVCGLGVSWLRNSYLGLRMLAVRDNERAATALGWSSAQTKLLAFVIAAGLAGLGGSLLGYQSSTVVYFQFTTMGSLIFLGFAYVTGIGSVAGALLAGVAASGGLVVTALQFVFPLGRVVDWVNLIFAVLVVLAVVLHPDGAMPALDGLKRRLVSRRRLVGAVGAGEVSGPAHAGSGADRLTSGTRLVPVRGSGAPGGTTRASHRAPGEEDHPETETHVLSANGLTVRFGVVVALDDVDLDVRAGRVNGLIGPNGSGKSTFVDAVSGLVPATGQVTLGGNPISSMRAHQRARSGLTRTFQSLELFEELTVRENILSGLVAQGQRVGTRSGRRLSMTRRVEVEMDSLGIAHLADLKPTQISTGQRRLVAVARALVADPQLVILDEPASGLDAEERQMLRNRIRGLLKQQTTVLLIEHDVELVFDVCQFVHVLDRGRVIASGTPEDLRRDQAVIAAYLGEEVEDAVLEGDFDGDLESVL